MPASRFQVHVLRVALVAAALIGLALLRTAPASAATACRLGGGAIKHVIIMQFDNVHLQRDNPNVPSDIEQIPALDNVLKDQGTLLSNDHTVLISHTADGILSTETGLYPSDFGGGVSNSYPYLDPNQTSTHASSSVVPGTNSSSLFKYWTDPTSTDDPLYTLDPPGRQRVESQRRQHPGALGGVHARRLRLRRHRLRRHGARERHQRTCRRCSEPARRRTQFGNWSFNTAFDQHFDAGSNLGTTDYRGSGDPLLAGRQRRPRALLARQRRRARRAAVGTGWLQPASTPTFGALAVDPVLTGKPDAAAAVDLHPRRGHAAAGGQAGWRRRSTTCSPPTPTTAGVTPSPPTRSHATVNAAAQHLHARKHVIHADPGPRRAIRASPALTAWRPTTRSATPPLPRRPASRSPTPTCRTSTMTSTTSTTATRSDPARPGSRRSRDHGFHPFDHAGACCYRLPGR